MKKLFFLLPFCLFCSLVTHGQISIDSIQTFSQNTTVVDSIFVSGISSGQQLENIKIFSTNDICGTVNVELNFKGCAPIHTSFFDTVIVIGYPTSRCRIVAKWDTVSACPYPNIPMDLDTLIWNNCSALSVQQELSNDQLKIYPIPSKGILQMEQEANIKILRIQLYNAEGKIVKEFGANEKVLDISYLSMGTYFLKVETEEGILTHKVIRD